MAGRKRYPEYAAAASNAAFIGKGTVIEGNCETEGTLRIEGRVTGNVRARTVELAPGGQIDGDVLAPKDDTGVHVFVIEGRVAGAVRAPRVEVTRDGFVDGGVWATEAVVYGRVRGGVVAEQRLVLEETGVVEGDVRARRLSWKEGGLVNGDIRMSDLVEEVPVFTAGLMNGDVRLQPRVQETA